MLLFGVPFIGNPLVFALGAGIVPVRRARPRRAHLDGLADHRAGHPDRVLLPPPADPAVGHDLPARRDGGRRALDRLSAAADVLHHDLPGGHAARRPDQHPVVAVPDSRRHGGRGVHRRRRCGSAGTSRRVRGRTGGVHNPATRVRRDDRTTVGDGQIRRRGRTRRRDDRGPAGIGRRRRGGRRRRQVHAAARARARGDTRRGQRAGTGQAAIRLPPRVVRVVGRP